MSILLACDFDAADWAAWLPALQAALPGERLLLPLNSDAWPRPCPGRGCTSAILALSFCCNSAAGTTTS